MNEEAINDAYTLFKGAGYKKSIDEFKNLINTNENALSDAYVLFQGAGYKNSIDDFSSLMGVGKADTVVKKKESDVTSPMEPMDSTLVQEDTSGLSESEELVGFEPRKLVTDYYQGETAYLIDRDEVRKNRVLEDKRFVKEVEDQTKKIAESYGDELDNEFYTQENVSKLINDANRKAKNQVQILVNDLDYNGEDINSEENKRKIEEYYSIVFDNELSSNEEFSSLMDDYIEVRSEKVFDKVKEYQEGAAKAKKAKDIIGNPIYESLIKIPSAKRIVDKYILSDGLIGQATTAFMYGKPSSKETVPIAEASLELKKDRSRLAKMEVDGVDEVVEYLPAIGPGAAPSKIVLTKDQVLDRIEKNSGIISKEGAQKIERALDLQKITQFLSPEDQFLEGDFTLTTLGGLVGEQLANMVEVPLIGTYQLELGAAYLDTVKEIAEYKYGESSPENIIKVIDNGEDGAAELASAAELSALIDLLGYIPIAKGASIATKGAIKAGSTAASKTSKEAFRKSVMGGVKNKIRNTINDKIKSKVAKEFIQDSYQVAKGSLIGGISEAPFEGTQSLLVSEAGRKTIEKATGQELDVDIEGALKEGAAGLVVGSIIPGATGAVSTSARTARNLFKPTKERLIEKTRNKIQDKSDLKSNRYLVNEDPKTRVQINEIIENAKSIEDLEGVSVNNDKGIEDKLASKTKELQDAIQEQETRDIPEAERAEGVQEVETEVREPDVETEVTEKERVEITPETSSNYANMTEDGDGNFVFFHKGKKGYDTIKKGTGESGATSRSEISAISKVGGVAMYYPSASVGERQVSGDATYAVKVPKEKVYDFNSDPLNFIEEARKRHTEENPNASFDANSQFAYVTQIANENGFEMVVGEWTNGSTRAQTTKGLSPDDIQERSGNTITKDFNNQYVDNRQRGFEPVIPITKEEKLQTIYDKIYKERNSNQRYDDLYRLRSEKTNYTQEEITELINNSDISQEIKDEYNNVFESKEEKRRSKRKNIIEEYASKEVERVKSLPIEAEDGATMNLDGSKYEDGGLVIPVASVNMKVSDLTTEAIEQFINENSKSIGADNVKVGIYKFPDSDDLSIDINIVADRSMREEALKIGKELGQESLFDLDTFENIKTGADGKNPKKLTPKEFLEIQERLNLETPQQGVEEETIASPDVTQEERGDIESFFGSETEETAAPEIKNQIDNARKALSSIAPDVEIILHDSEQAYAEATNEQDRNQKTSGTYQEAEVNGKLKKAIHINPEKYNARTVAHESFHAILLSAVKTEVEVRRLTDAMMKAASKAASPELKSYLDEFASNYDQNIQNEEKLAELVGKLAAEYDTLPQQTQSVIKRWLDRLAKLFGLKQFTDTEVIDVLNTIAGKVSRGENITGQDLSSIQSNAKYVSEDEARLWGSTPERKQIRTKPDPKKTVKAYKMFRVKDTEPGKLFPLFVKANEEVLIGKWLDAEVGDLTSEGKVKSKIGGLAYRPGWHMGDLPIATHIGDKYDFKKGSINKDLKKPTARNANHVWAEVEVSADVDWQQEANNRASRTKDGKIIPRTAHITDGLPEDGYYRYKTNPNMTGEWLIGGSIKVNRVLTDDQVKSINDAAGVADLPRVKPINLQELGFKSKKEIAKSRKQTASKASSVEMFENPDTLQPKRMKNGRTKVIELGRAFDKRAKDNGYYIPLPKDGAYTDTQLNKIAEAMADDAQLQLLQDDSGIGWYDLKTRSAMELMSRIHPELSNPNSEAHLKFTLMVALISQNNSVGINFRQANEAYTYYKNNNKLPDRKYAGKSGNIIKQNIASSFEAIKKKNWENYKNKLQQTKTVKEWEAEGYKINGENKTTKITGAMAMLGSKIGSFWGNLNGDFDTLTADLWFSRMFNRYTGNVVAKDKTEGSKKATLEAIKSYRGSELLYGFSKADLLKGGEKFNEWLNTITKNYAKGGYKSKIPLNIVSNTHFKNLAGSLQDLPRGGGERNAMRDVVKRVQDKLIERGYPKLDIADIQAIVWYNEKDLYRQYKAVNKSSEKTDYETAAQEVLREQGVNAEVALPFKRSKPSADGGGNQTDAVQSKSLSSEVTPNISREQRTSAAPSQQKSMNEVIQEARQSNFRDAAIRDYLIRVRGLKAKVVDAAMDIQADLFSEMPNSFKNITGGAQSGVDLFKRVDGFRRKLQKSNSKRTRLSPSEVEAKVREFAKEQKKTYKKVTEINEEVKNYKTKLLKANAKRKSPLTNTQINDKVRQFKKQKTEERKSKKDIADNKIIEFKQKEIARNNKRKAQLTDQEIVDKTIEFLEKQPEYIAESDTFTTGSTKKGTKETKLRKGLSTQQANMISDLQKSVGVRPTEDMAAKIRKARLIVRERGRGARDLDAVKREIRNFIRKTIPADAYSKRDVINLIRKVTDGTQDNIENIMSEVEEFAVEKNVGILSKKINDILNAKYETVQSGRKKAKGIDLETRESIQFIKSNILSEATAEEITSKNEDLTKMFNDLDAKPDKTESDFARMADIEVAININNAELMDNNDVHKVAALDVAGSALSDMVKFGRSALKQELAEAQLEYERQFSVVYEDVVGQPIDMTNRDAARKKLEDAKKARGNEAERSKVRNRVISYARSIGDGLSGFFVSHEALDGLMDKISSLPGEMFGGRTQEEVTDRVDSSSRRFKERRMYVESRIKQKLSEIYGKNWSKQERANRTKKVTGIYLNKKTVEQAQDAYNKDKTGTNKRVLRKVIAQNELILSQNEMYYLYNQYKDPANRRSFEKTFGSDYVRVMQEIETALRPEVKEFADWQVDQFFPELYEVYNVTYRNIYRTNMPWNKYYAGRIYRVGLDPEPIDLLGKGNIYNTAVGAASTKVRTQNNLPIRKIDGTDALITYLYDMEYFAAYGETIRDVNKLFNNEYIKSAITDIHGRTTMDLINDQIQKIAAKGIRTGFQDRLVNSMNNVFIMSRIALSPVIMIKQLTSVFTYANDIGYGNWIKYGAKNIAELKSVYEEVRDNSVYMQDRKNQSIMKTIESYSDGNMQTFVPNQTKEWLINFMMWTTKFGDRSAIYLGGLSNYSYYKAQALKQGKTEQEAIDYAIIKFEKNTKRTQQSSDLQDKDIFQTSNPLVRAANMFLTTPKQYLRKEIQAMRSLFRKIKALDRNAGKGSVGENIRTLAMYHVFLPVVFQYVALGLPGLLRGWREDDDEDLLRAGILGNLNGLFIMGEVATGLGDYFTGKPWAGEGSKSLGVLNIFSGIIQDLKRADKLKDPEKKDKAYKDFYLQLMTLTGIPAPTLDRFIENYGDIGKGGDIGKDIMRLLNFSQYQIEGPPKREKKPKTIEQMDSEYYRQLESEERAKKIEERQMKEEFGGGFGTGGFDTGGFGGGFDTGGF